MVTHLHHIPALNSFRTLCSEDPEVDFFNNIVHLQVIVAGFPNYSCDASGSFPHFFSIGCRYIEE